MIKHSSSVLIIIYKKLFLCFFKACPCLSLRRNVFMEHRQVSRYTCVKSTDNFIKHCLLFTDSISSIIFRNIETILLIHKPPNWLTIIIRIRLDIIIQIEILSLIILFILNMPDPVHFF